MRFITLLKLIILLECNYLPSECAADHSIKCMHTLVFCYYDKVNVLHEVNLFATAQITELCSAKPGLRDRLYNYDH